jgi:hypothetical protein
LILSNLTGKGLFVFSDPGGAKPVLSFINLYKNNNNLVISDREYDFFSDYGVEVTKYCLGDEKKVIEVFKPDFVFTGTSYTSTIELQFIEEANTNNIPTFSYIDHYTRYSDRFFLNNKYVFPRHIFVTDRKARDIATSEKIDTHSRVSISGNFHHDFLKKWAPKGERNAILPFLGIDEKLIVFAPDPISNVGGIEKYKYDETTVWNQLALVLHELRKYLKFQVVIKMHPNQPRKYLSDFIANSSFSNVIYGDGLHTNSLIYFSDVIIGMYSSFLIEAKLFDKRIVRYLPNPNDEDALENMNVGVTCSDFSSLKAELKLSL